MSKERPLQPNEKTPEVESGAPSHLVVTPGICFAVSEGYRHISKSANLADDFVLCGKITPLSSGSTCLCSRKGR